ncbi:MAG: oligosaccharide flippase family protein, partial [Sulfurovaceae bacterium]|nr:oligosaccharide flippase family protein [Sulfurovaceae bacterium]
MIDILKGSALILGFKIFGTIAIFLIHLIISRYYGVQILGIFNLILALMMVGAILSRIGLNVYVIRIIPSLENNKQQIALFLKEVIKIVFIGSVITSTLFYLFSNTINIYIFKSFDASEYLFYLIIIIIPFSLFTTLVEVFRGFHEIKKYAFFKNSSQNLIIMILLLISILFSLNINPIYILYSSTLITTLLLTIFLFKFLKKQSIPLIIKDRYKDKILIYSYPMFLTSSMMFLITYTDIFMISYFISESDVGF